MFRIIISFAAALFIAPLTQAHAQEINTLQPQEPPSQEEVLEDLRVLQEAINKAEAENDNELAEREDLYKILKQAQSEVGGRFVADAIWNNWMDSAPNEEVAKLVSDAMERRRWYDYEGARVILNKAVKAAPEYSEVWNQRAYILFLQEKFDESLDDIEKALNLEPRHFAALSGKARILFHQGRHELAQVALKKAVDIHPWIYERFLLAQEPVTGQEPLETKVGDEL